VYNLRQNAELVHKVNSGEVSVEALLRMSHQDLAGTSTVARRQRLHAEDQSTFAVRCGNCGSEDARGVMTQTSGPQDEGWSQMSVRGSCPHCGHVWLDGRE
ncbi:unnamed protein product, partial [Symbiodinium necroappetens]